MGEPRLQVLRVLRGQLLSAAAGSPDHHGDRHLAAEHVAYLRGVVDDLIHSHEREVDCHELYNGAESEHRGPNASAGDRCFRDRGVLDALRAELGEQALGDPVCPLELADILPDDEHVRVTVHLLAESVIEGFAVCLGRQLY